MSQHLISTRPVDSHCRHCGTAILIGLAEGLAARVDAIPIPPRSEVDALIEGRWTYTRRPAELIHRDARRIAGNSLFGAIHAEHRCPPAYGQPTLPTA